MDFLNQIKIQLTNMSETEKDTWILSQAKLLTESDQQEFLMSLSGEKKVIHMPSLAEIDEFCEKVENEEIYFEYETHYYEFDNDGRYMDDWETWHNDPFDAIPFLNRIFLNCHDLLRLEEYQTVEAILGQVCDLQFPVVEAEDSEDSPEEEVFTLVEADQEGMFSRDLCDVGADWIRAVIKLTENQENRKREQKLIEMFEHPVCQKVKPRILAEEGISGEIYSDMATLLEGEIAELEALMEKKFPKSVYSREKYAMMMEIERKKEILLDIRVKCLKTTGTDKQGEGADLSVCWEQIKEGIKWLSYEKCIDDQAEIDEIQNICIALIEKGKLDQEDWKMRQKVLGDIVNNAYYNAYNCSDVMEELVKKLCTNQEEYLAYADILNASGRYREKAAHLYYQYGRDDKYVSYLESHLDRGSKEYSALLKYYQSHNRQEDARRVAEQGLEKCREDLTDIFICLLLDAQKCGDQKRFQRLLASAKRRKHVDIGKVKNALYE